jgi:hypothetical protein
MAALLPPPLSLSLSLSLSFHDRSDTVQDSRPPLLDIRSSYIFEPVLRATCRRKKERGREKERKRERGETRSESPFELRVAV